MAKLVGRPEQAGAANHPPRRPHTLLLSVSHGDLRLSKYPLAVGHYHGDTIVHAEARLDKQLKGRLTELFNLYLYPGPVGSMEVVHVSKAKPPGALVIGLGNVGEIRPSIVRDGVSNAALRHALILLNNERDKDVMPSPVASENGVPQQTWVSAGISTLLLGTFGGNALSIEASLSAIVQGVVQANEALRSQDLWDKVRINEVQFVELYEDVAREAMRAAVYLTEHPPSYLSPGDALQVEPLHVYPLGNGRTQRPIDPYTRGWWRRIKVTTERGKDGEQQGGNADDAAGEEGLRFLALTDRARAEDTLQPTQGKFIKKAVENALSSPRYAEELATLLFNLLIPNSIKELVSAETDLVLVLDSKSAQYPWELLAERTRNGVEPLAVRMGVIRQFITANFDNNPQPARERNALVIGVPKSKEVPLPGARREAVEVAKVLKDAEYDVGDGALLDAGPLEVVGRLFAKSYKIIHLAGHGKYVQGKPAESGMILDEDMLLTSMELSKLPTLPELVFINCCHLGELDEKPTTSSPHALAASVSEELIKMGVKAVVAAGWAVDDKAAESFAKTFYQGMLRGEKFGMAVLSARIAARAAGGNSSTWGAYQCYGNPDFVLTNSGDGSESARLETRCYSRREYLEQLEDFKADAARADGDALIALSSQLKELDQKIPDIWRDGAVLRAIGDAWAALGFFDKAIDNYRAATKEEKAEAPLNTIEQLANMLSRHANNLRVEASMSGNGAQAAEIGDFMNEALQRLNWLFDLGQTSERFSLMGGYYKRKAAASPKRSEKEKFLALAEENYGKACGLYKGKLRFVKPFPAINWLTCRFLLSHQQNGAGKLKGASKLIDECKQIAFRNEQNEPSIWNRVTGADSELLLSLIHGDLTAKLEGIIILYQRAIETGVTQRDLSSIVQNFVFLREMITTIGKKSAVADENVRALERLQKTFGSKN